MKSRRYDKIDKKEDFLPKAFLLAAVTTVDMLMYTFQHNELRNTATTRVQQEKQPSSASQGLTTLDVKDK